MRWSTCARNCASGGECPPLVFTRPDLGNGGLNSIIAACWFVRELNNPSNAMNHPLILVAVDFSTGSRSALEHAARLAAKQNARLHILHVIDALALSSLADHRGESFEAASRVAFESGRKSLDVWLARSPLPAGHEITICIGNPLHEILEHAKKFHASLLVVGIAGAGGNASGAGSTSLKIARKSPVNVLLVRQGHPQPFTKVVACLDLSDITPKVVLAARDIAIQEGAAVDWLHVWNDPGFMMPLIGPFGESGIGMATDEMPRHDELAARITAQLHAAVAEASSGLTARELLKEAARAGHGIEQHVTETSADLLVLGAHGHSALHYVLLGSTPERLLARLTCSMLVVKDAS